MSITRYFLCWAMAMILPPSLLGQAPSQGPPAAILHTQGGVWVNNYEARDSTAIFTGDLLETKPGFTATLNLEGSELQIQPQSVLTFQGDSLTLDYGNVAVGTSKNFKVKVKCITVEPLSPEWTQYEVIDVNGTVQVAARKKDVKVELGLGGQKPTPQPGASSDGTVHEGEQASYQETEVCGNPPQPSSPSSSGLNTKWIEIGGGVAGGVVLLCALWLCRGSSKPPVSPDQP